MSARRPEMKEAESNHSVRPKDDKRVVIENVDGEEEAEELGQGREFIEVRGRKKAQRKVFE